MFIKTVRKRALVNFCILAGCAAAGWGLLTWPQAAAGGISRGLAICSGVIIPSLFPFLVLSGMMIKSGAGDAIGRRMEWLIRRVFALPGCCATAILMGMISGFPAGAAAVGELVAGGDITPAQGRRMMCFCVNGGPAFIISAVGVGMLGSAARGAILYAAHIAASLIIGICCGFAAPKGERRAVSRKTVKIKRAESPAAAFVGAVSDAGRVLVGMCGFVLLFSAVLSVLDGMGVSDAVTAIAPRGFAGVWRCVVPGFLEVSCGSLEAAAAGELAPLILGMVMGWGGLSVQCQVSSVLRGRGLITRKFFVFRIIHALSAGLLSLALFRYFPFSVELPAMSVLQSAGVAEAVIIPVSVSVAVSTAMLAACLAAMLATEKKA